MCYTELLLLRQKAETHSTGFNKKINREAEWVINYVNKLIENKEMDIKIWWTT
jgi:hypothetical protein